MPTEQALSEEQISQLSFSGALALGARCLFRIIPAYRDPPQATKKTRATSHVILERCALATMALSMDAERLAQVKPRAILYIKEAETLATGSDGNSAQIGRCAMNLVLSWATNNSAKRIYDVVAESTEAFTLALPDQAGTVWRDTLRVDFSQVKPIGDMRASVSDILGQRLWPIREPDGWSRMIVAWYQELNSLGLADIAARYSQLRAGLGKGLEDFYQGVRSVLAGAPKAAPTLVSERDRTPSVGIPLVDLQVRTTGGVAQLPPPGSPLNILSVATEWFSGKGGLSTFNRDLCLSLEKIGHHVLCVVDTDINSEVLHARDRGIELVRSAQGVRLQGDGRYIFAPYLPDGFRPHVIIGHGRVTGGGAYVLQSQHYRDALRIHFIHVDPGEIEWYKGRRERLTMTVPDAGDVKRQREKIAREREQTERWLGQNADLVAAVGPRLDRVGYRLLDGIPDCPSILQFNPGCPRERSTRIPKTIECLVFGRMEDADLKGLDIAARAFSRLSAKDLERWKPILSVRGVPPEEADRMKEDLAEMSGLRSAQIRLDEFTSDEDELVLQIRKSSVVMMPSRGEGFGLAGMEAIGLGTPTLISKNSGLGELLESIAPEFAKEFVVPVEDNKKQDAKMWSKRLRWVLRHRERAFELIGKLRDALRERLSWENAARDLITALYRRP